MRKRSAATFAFQARQRITDRRQSSRFEHATGDHHDHLIDIETGDVIEFKSDRIEKLQDEIAKSLGYDIVHHRLELYGRKRHTG